MCMCERPNINGKHGYRWNESTLAGVHPVNPPALRPGDEILYDEPGRCGGLDSHSYHFRVVKRYGRPELLVRHGGGDECIPLGSRPGLAALEWQDSDGRYWLLQMIYHSVTDIRRAAVDAERSRWALAAVQNRIKVNRRKRVPTVEILPAETATA